MEVLSCSGRLNVSGNTEVFLFQIHGTRLPFSELNKPFRMRGKTSSSPVASNEPFYTEAVNCFVRLFQSVPVKFECGFFYKKVKKK